MGRLKSWQSLHPIFSGKYKKLFEDYSSKDSTKLLMQDSAQDALSYSCSECGHIQRLEAEELNAIVGHAFRLAYAAHLQKSGSALRDVSSSGSTPRSNTPSDQLHFVPSHSRSTPSSSLSGSFCRSHSVHKSSTSSNSSSKHCNHVIASSSPLDTCHHSGGSSSISSSASCSSLHCGSPSSCSSRHSAHQRSSRTHCSGRNSQLSQSHHRISPFSTQCENSETEDESSCNRIDNKKTCFSSQDFQGSCERLLPSTDSMRTPRHSPAITRHHQTGSLGSCAFKPPSTLPLIHYSDHENNILHTPDSDTSNSPTELNTSKRLLDKPPLIKNVNLTNNHSNITFDDDFSPNITSCGTSLPASNTLSSGRNLSGNSLTVSHNGISVVGYVNERLNGDKATSSDLKCHQQDELTLKRISQLSVCSSGISENVALDISSCSSHSCTPPPLPERSDSLTPPEEPHLKAAAWFQAGIPREIALEVLSREPVGAFMVRESTSKPGCYALSLRVPRDFTVSGIAHYLIVKTNKGYKIKGFTKEFITLTALITHHSVMPELLPCPLSLSRYNPTFTTEDSNRNDPNDEEDPDYNTLSDFRKMMADLDV